MKNRKLGRLSAGDGVAAEAARTWEAAKAAEDRPTNSRLFIVILKWGKGFLFAGRRHGCGYVEQCNPEGRRIRLTRVNRRFTVSHG